MRVVSLVPSWTETLLEAGVEVVGRTRFCIHPKQQVEAIPVVGGTKRVDSERLAALAPDLLVLDQEENTLEIAEGSPVPYFASHVRAVEDVARDLSELARRLAPASAAPAGDDGGPAGKVEAIAERWRRAAALPEAPARPLEELPGVLEWVRRPGPEHQRFVYLVWREPWMAVGPGTFIGSVFRRLGFGEAHQPSEEPYPVVELATLDPQRTVLLFASEPFPFERFPELMAECGFSAALVDGEAFSWFGVRTLRFLERELAR